MAFQIKNFVSIVAAMINRMKATQNQLTDFTIGAVGRTMIEAPAIEIDQLYQQMFNGLVEAIPVSVFQSFNFPPLTPLAATGTIQVTITAATTPVLVSAGTLFASASSANVYASTADILFPAGATSAGVQVAATTTGSSTNLVEDVSFTLTPSPSGFVSATNTAPFVNGQDAETTAQQQVRFAAYIASLPRGTIAALYYGMTLANVQDANGNVIEKVMYSSVVEPWLTDQTQPVSVVNCYIHNGVGNTSTALQNQTQNILTGYYTNGTPVPGYKAAGVKTTVLIATEVPINVAGVVTVLPGYSFTDQVASGVTVSGINTLATAAIYSYLQGLPLVNYTQTTAGATAPVPTGSAALMADITALVMAIPGVYNYAPSLPATDIAATTTQKIMPGNITLTAAP